MLGRHAVQSWRRRCCVGYAHVLLSAHVLQERCVPRLHVELDRGLHKAHALRDDLRVNSELPAVYQVAGLCCLWTVPSSSCAVLCCVLCCAVCASSLPVCWCGGHERGQVHALEPLVLAKLDECYQKMMALYQKMQRDLREHFPNPIQPKAIQS